MRVSGIFIAIIFSFLGAGCSHLNLRPEIDEVGISDPKTNFSEQYAVLEARILKFNDKWQNLERKQWSLAETTAVGGGASVIAIAAHATPYAVAGAAVAGLAGITDKFYGTDKQNSAWTKASHTLQCIRAFSSTINVAGDAALEKIQSPEFPDSETAAQFTLRVLKDAMWTVDRTLEDRLRIAAVNTEPNWSAFAIAVKNAANSASATVSDTQPFMDATPEKKKAFLALVGRYKSDLDSCLQQFGSPSKLLPPIQRTFLFRRLKMRHRRSIFGQHTTTSMLPRKLGQAFQSVVNLDKRSQAC